jgi:hypothetical protein
VFLEAKPTVESALNVVSSGTAFLTKMALFIIKTVFNKQVKVINQSTED